MLKKIFNILISILATVIGLAVIISGIYFAYIIIAIFVASLIFTISYLVIKELRE